MLADGAGGMFMRKAAVVAVALLLASCATITKGTTQLVAVDTPGVPGAICTISTTSGPQVVTTPGTVTLAKGANSLPIQCAKQCYLPGTGIIPSNAEAMAAGNVVFGGVIGLGVDAATGAMNHYADQVTVAMLPDPACRQAPPPLSRRQAPAVARPIENRRPAG